jgi:hypothetical protein
MKAIVLSVIFPLIFSTGAHSQDTLSLALVNPVHPVFSGFVRGGLYSWMDRTDNKPYVSTGFSDLGLRMEAGNGVNFKTFADLRYRYGSEFLKPVSRFDLREAYIKVNGKKWDFTAGQKIIKWGRCDFTNPVSKLSPQNMIARSPDREDMDMGNLLAAINWYPTVHLGLTAIIVPFYRPSTLLIDPVPLPENTVINKTAALLTGSSMFGYGLRANFNLKGLDFSLSWFDGHDPLPGIALDKFTLDLTQTTPVPYTGLSIKPYKTRMLGVDFETTAGAYGIRSEAAWTFPYLSYKSSEYVAMPEIKWAAGIDRLTGIWHFTAEYSGKYITDFTPEPVESIIGTPADYLKIAEMLSIPGFDLTEYVRQEVGAFNRLYNYQLKKYYHSIGFRAEAEMIYGKLIPSLFGMYNITAGDLLLIPEIRYKPADGLTVTVGAEIYSGRSCSLYDIINDFMNGVYISIKADF